MAFHALSRIILSRGDSSQGLAWTDLYAICDGGSFGAEVCAGDRVLAFPARDAVCGVLGLDFLDVDGHRRVLDKAKGAHQRQDGAGVTDNSDLDSAAGAMRRHPRVGGAQGVHGCSEIYGNLEGDRIARLWIAPNHIGSDKCDPLRGARVVSVLDESCHAAGAGSAPGKATLDDVATQLLLFDLLKEHRAFGGGRHLHPIEFAGAFVQHDPELNIGAHRYGLSIQAPFQAAEVEEHI
mmetsp:Transcript_16456/g.45867  ORF Transcript_16456/g.45867 Transcript_16456/m.45867 type:complete len:237 (-) Transcript_16456:2027-2737(-)